MFLPKLLMHLSAFSVLFPITISIRRYQALDQLGCGFSAYIYLSGLFELAGLITWHFKVNNLPLFHLFVLLKLLFFGWVYVQAFKNVLLKRLVTVLTVLLGMFTVASSMLLESIWTFNSISATVESVFLIVLSLLMFGQLLLQHEVVFLDREPLFWLNSGVLLYFAGNLFVFMLQHTIAGSAQKGYVYGIVHSGINILANLLYGIALLCRPRLPS
jgi:hypothetical protein